MVRHFLYIIFLSGITLVQAGDTLLLKKNLRSEWLIYSDEAYLPFDSVKLAGKVIHFFLPVNLYKGDYVGIRSSSPVSIFINGKLWYDREVLQFINLDSMARHVEEKLVLMTIHQEGGIRSGSLTTWAGSYVKAIPAEAVIAKSAAVENFRNFLVMVILILVGSFTILLRLNPVVTTHYYSILKLFSLRESDDTQSLNRLLNSSNILIYVFAALLSGFAIFLWHISSIPELNIIHVRQEVSFLELVFQWGKVCIIILLIFFGKALLVAAASALFGVSELSGFQFANFIRIVLVSMTLIVVLGGIILLVGGHSKVWSSFFSPTVNWIILGWLILIFLKLLRRVPFSPFHLFSYICATEIIPLLFLVNILYE